MTLAAGTVDFLCLGAQKCGTSALTALLGEHPQLSVPRHAAGSFGAGGGDRGTRRLLDNAFAGAAPDARLGIVNPRYMIGYRTTTVGTIAQTIHAEAPEARFIVIVRDPIERAISHWRMARRRGRVSASFDEAVLQPPHNATEGDVNAMISVGLYGRALAPYLERFPRDRFLVITNEDLGARARSTLARVFSHLDVDHDFVPASIDQRVHESGSAERLTPEGARMLLAYLDDHWFAGLQGPDKWQQQAAFRFWFDRFNVIPDDHLPQVSDEVRSRLIDVFLPDAELLEPVMGRLPPWVRRGARGRLVWRGR